MVLLTFKNLFNSNIDHFQKSLSFTALPSNTIKLIDLITFPAVFRE